MDTVSYVLNLDLQISKTTIRMREGFKAHEVVNEPVNEPVNELVNELVNRHSIILSELKKAPKLSMKQLSEVTGISLATVKRNIATLKQNNLLVRVGPDKGGHWEVIE